MTSAVCACPEPVEGVLEAVDRRDVRMIQRGQDFRFTLKPRQSIRIARDGLRQDLQCDGPLEVGVRAR